MWWTNISRIWNSLQYFKNDSHNRHHVRHNAGTLQDDIKNELKRLDDYAIECWNKGHYKLKDDMYKIYFKRVIILIRKPKKQIIFKKEAIQKNKSQIGSQNIKLAQNLNQNRTMLTSKWLRLSFSLWTKKPRLYRLTQ